MVVGVLCIPNVVPLSQSPQKMSQQCTYNMYLSCFKESHFVFDLLLLTTDLDRQLNEAEAMTESLRAESQFVSQKPLTDSTCLRWVSSTVGMLGEVYIFGHTDSIQYLIYLQLHYVTEYNAAGK